MSFMQLKVKRLEGKLHKPWFGYKLQIDCLLQYLSIEGKKGLFEIRIELGGDIFRVFCCFDEGSLVILFNGFQKKTQKTPSREIEKAERLMKEYFKSKESKE